LVVKGLTVKYSPLPFNQSVVESVDFSGGSCVVAMEAGYLGFDDPFFVYNPAANDPKRDYGVLFDDATGLQKPGVGRNFCRLLGYQALGGGRFRLQVLPEYQDYLAHFSPGDRFVYNGRMLGRNVFSLKDFEPTGEPYNRPPVTIESCVALSSISQFISLDACPGVTNGKQSEVLNCSVIPAAGGALISTNADPLYVTDCRVGPLVEGCHFGRMSDDGMNFHTKARRFQGYPNSAAGDYSVVDLGRGVRLLVGDALQFYFPPTGEVLTADVVSVSPLETLDGDEKAKRVLLSGPVAGLQALGDTSLVTSLAWNMSASNPGLVVRNNVISDGRGRGIIINSTSGLCASNTVSRVSDSGIVIANINSIGSLEGPVPQGIVVSGNTVRSSGYLASADRVAQGSSILFGGLKGTEYFAPSVSTTPAFGIVVEANTVEDWNTVGVWAAGIANCAISPVGLTYNRFKGVVSPTSRAIGIYEPASSTSIVGVNTVLASGLDYAVLIGSGVDASVSASSILVSPPTKKKQDLRP